MKIIESIKYFITQRKFYFLGYVISFLVFFIKHAPQMEDWFEWLLLFISANLAGAFSWCYLCAKVLLLAI